MSENKLIGICKTVSESRGGILIITPTHKDGVWWNGLGEQAKNQVKFSLKGKEIELTIVNQEKHSFSYLTVLNGSVNGRDEEGDTKLRSMAVAYSKDLIVGDKVEMSQLEATASRIFKFIKGV